MTGNFYSTASPVQTVEHTTDISRCDRLWNHTARLLGMSPPCR